MTSTARENELDRPSRIRQALRQLVAEHGFHGASMAAIAKRAGVATGTAYVHYSSKDDVVIAAYLEAKENMAVAAALDNVAADQPMADRFRHMWMNIYRYLAISPDVAQFMLQVEASPYAMQVHPAQEIDPDNSLIEALGAAPNDFVDLPVVILFDLAMGPALRLAASGEKLDDKKLEVLATSCWLAVHKT